MEQMRVKESTPVSLRGGGVGRCRRVLTLSTQPHLLVVHCDRAIVAVEARREKWRLPSPAPAEKFASYVATFEGVDYLLVSFETGIAVYKLHGDGSPQLLANHSYTGALRATHVTIGRFYPESDYVGVMAAFASMKIKFFYFSLKDNEFNKMSDRGVTVQLDASRRYWSHTISGMAYDYIFERTDAGVDCFYFDSAYRTVKLFSFTGLDKSECETITFKDSKMVVANGKEIARYKIDSTGMQLEAVAYAKGCSAGGAPVQFNALYAVAGPSFVSLDAARSVSYAESDSAVPLCAVGSDALLLQTGEGALRLDTFENATAPSLPVLLEEEEESSAETTEAPQRTVTHVKRVEGKLDVPLPHLPWTLQHDYSFLNSAVNIATGGLEFKLPLLNVPVFMENEFQTRLYYSSETRASTTCGQGWQISLPENFIRVEKTGIFPSDRDFFFDGDGGQVQMKRKAGSQNAFESELFEGTTIVHDEERQTWLVDTPERTLEYGGKGAVQWTLEWPEWQGAGTNLQAMVRRPTRWYLRRSVEKRYGRNFNYKYVQTNRRFIHDGPEYTLSTNLVEIEAEETFKIDFEYAEKSENEYNEFKMQPGEPFTMPPFFENNFYLQSVTLTSSRYRQNFQLAYTKIENRIFLAGVNQQITDYIIPLFRFTYDKSTSKIDSILTSDGVVRSYKYDFFHLPELLPASEYKHKFQKILKTSSFGNYKVVVQYDYFEQKVTINVITDSDVRQLGVFNFQSDVTLDVFPDENSFVVIFFIDKINSKLLFFSKSLTGWTYNANEDASYASQVKFKKISHGLLVQLARNVKIKTWDAHLALWEEKDTPFVNEIDVAVPGKQFFAVIDTDKNLIVIILDKSNEEPKTITLDRYYTTNELNGVLNMFNHEASVRKQLEEALFNQALQTYENTIMVKNVYLKEHHLYCDVDVYVINEMKILKRFYSTTLVNIDITELKFEHQYQDDPPASAVFQYTFSNGRYELNVEHIKSREYDTAAGQKALRQNLTQQYKQAKFLDDRNIVPWEKLSYLLSSKGINGYEKHYMSTGTTMALGKYGKDSIGRIGPHITLSQDSDNGSTIKITSKETKPFLMKRDSTFVTEFPRYLAFQNDLQATVLLLSDDGSVSKSFNIPNAQLWDGNATHLTYLEKSNGVDYESSYVEAPIFKICGARTRAVVTRQQLSSESRNRVTNLEWVTKSWKQILVKKFWNDSPQVNGREELLLTAAAAQPIMEKSHFTCSGELENEIKVVSNRVQDSKEGGDSSSTIFDVTGNKIIARLAPYSTENDEASYYGFEVYEVNDRIWKFDKELLHNSDCFTGKRCLKLTKTNKLEGNFTPKLQNGVYIVGSWIKLGREVSLESPIKELRANIHTSNGEKLMTILGVVHRKGVNGWVYAELYINTQVLEDAEAFNLPSDMRNKDFTSKFTFQIVFGTVGYNSALLIDHVKFYPIDLNMEATVFEESDGKIDCNIKGNGEIERYLQDAHHQHQIGTCNENYELHSFKAAYVMKMGGQIGRVKISVSFSSGHVLHLSRTVLHDIILTPIEDFNIIAGNIVHERVQSGSISFPEQKQMAGCGFRMQYQFVKNGSLSLDFAGNKVKITYKKMEGQINEAKNFVLSEDNTIGDIIFIREGKRVVVFINGQSIFDQFIQSEQIETAITVSGYVLLSNIMKFENVGVNIEYFNKFDEKIQVLQLATEDSVLVCENMFDVIGRQAISTKLTKIVKKPTETLLAYQHDFVTNEDEVWSTGLMKGLVAQQNQEDEGYPYSRTVFKCSSLDIETAIGQPGKEYSVAGAFHKVKNVKLEIPVIENMFPDADGYHYEITGMPNGSFLVNVYDIRRNKVATYVKVEGYDNRLTTYYFDGNDKLLEVYAPNYYEHFNNSTLGPQKSGSILKVVYDDQGNISKKITPDSGSQEFYHDELNQKAFEVITDEEGRCTNVFYFRYDRIGNLIETGTVIGIFNEERTYDVFQNAPYRKIFQKFDLFDDDVLPTRRGKLKKLKTNFEWDENPFNNVIMKGSVVEEFAFNSKGDLLTRTTTVAGADMDLVVNFKVSKQYSSGLGRLEILSYPLKSGKYFHLKYIYDKLGNLVGMANKSGSVKYFEFSYNELGNIVIESHLGDGKNHFERNFSYNSPGFLTEIVDPFFKETIQYIEHGYGQRGFGDGIITETTFSVDWDKRRAHSQGFTLNRSEIEELPITCLRNLERLNIISEDKRVIRGLLPRDKINLPNVCLGTIRNKMEEMLASKISSEEYSYRFRYGSHQELLAAKYIREKTEITNPLTLDGLSETIGYDGSSLWTMLERKHLIITDNTTYDLKKAIAKVFDSFASLPFLDNSNLHTGRIVSLVEKTYFENGTITENNLKESFLEWAGCKDTECTSTKATELQNEAKSNWSTLNDNQILRNGAVQEMFLDQKWSEVVSKFPTNAFKMLKLLYDHRENGLLSHPFDFEAFDSDANGNHKKFYEGRKRYRLEYVTGTNKIEKIHLTDGSANIGVEKTFPVVHDERGNMLSALHRNIRQISYHPLSQRTTQIDLHDGRVLRFVYDAAGERILKLVYDDVGFLTSRTMYVRDENARVLVDVTTEFSKTTKRQKVTETVYLHGPRGLVGFIRENEFYSVITDHAGSIRLVLKGTKVVAAYDYYPYGELQRSFEDGCTMRFRYTGQEWDEETGLYNYHARLYDPSIGRFYQPDPQAQYANPYLYAGNSPVSLVDPDGEFAFILCIAIGTAIAGAYMGGAAVSGEWNPGKWNWKSGELYAGIIGGAIGGAFIPFTVPVAFANLGFGGTFLVVLFSSGTAYVSTAAANTNWNPGKWDWESPATVNGIIMGFFSGVGLVGGVKVAHTTGLQFIAKHFDKFKYAPKIFLGVSYTIGAGAAYGKMSSTQNHKPFWEWDFTSPSLYGALVDGFDAGFGWPQNFLESGVGIAKLFKNSRGFAGMGKSLTKSSKILNSPMFKTISSLSMGALMMSSANGFYQNGFDNDYTTYEALLNGIFFGKDIRNLLKAKEILTSEKTIGKAKVHSDDHFSGKIYDVDDANLRNMLLTYVVDDPDVKGNAKSSLLRDLDKDAPLRLHDVILKLKELDISSKIIKKLKLLEADIDEIGVNRKKVFLEDEIPGMICSGRFRRSVLPLNPQPTQVLRVESSSHRKSTATNAKEVWCRKGEDNDTFWCFHDSLSILVRPHRGDCDLFARAAPPPTLQGDSFSECRRLGDGQVFCQGQRSSIVVTQTPHFNILDGVAANAMLLRVVAHAGAALWRSVTRKEVPKITVDRARVCKWRAALRSLREVQRQVPLEKWVLFEVEDCERILDEIRDAMSVDDVEALEERLQALAEDLSECIGDQVPLKSALQFTKNMLSTAPDLIPMYEPRGLNSTHHDTSVQRLGKQ